MGSQNSDRSHALRHDIVVDILKLTLGDIDQFGNDPNGWLLLQRFFDRNPRIRSQFCYELTHKFSQDDVIGYNMLWRQPFGTTTDFQIFSKSCALIGLIAMFIQKNLWLALNMD